MDCPTQVAASAWCTSLRSRGTPWCQSTALQLNPVLSVLTAAPSSVSGTSGSHQDHRKSLFMNLRWQWLKSHLKSPGTCTKMTDCILLYFCLLQVQCCCFSPGKAILVFAGTSVGSVVLWDLREHAGNHYHLKIGQDEWTFRQPTFSTGRLVVMVSFFFKTWHKRCLCSTTPQILYLFLSFIMKVLKYQVKLAGMMRPRITCRL